MWHYFIGCKNTDFMLEFWDDQGAVLRSISTKISESVVGDIRLNNNGT